MLSSIWFVVPSLQEHFKKNKTHEAKVIKTNVKKNQMAYTIKKLICIQRETYTTDLLVEKDLRFKDSAG